MKPDELLTHSDFVRTLSRNLVLDENAAADVEQRTWLAALEHPPAGGNAIRGWFSRVIRNVVVTMYRGESRRQKYETSSEESPSISTPDEIAIRKETLRNLTEAVLSLEEPYLSVIMLRFYENLPARTVADRLGIPHETVKTRIQRGLILLRNKLDSQHDGSRKKWCMALAPFAGLKLAPTTAAAASATAATVGASGVLVMLAKLKLGIAAALILGITYTLVQFFPDSSPEPMDPAADLAAVALGGDGDRIDPSPSEDPTAREGNGETDREKVAASGFLLAGQVIDKGTGKPLQAFDFKMRVYKDQKWISSIHETVHHEEGRFSFPLKQSCTCSFRIRSSEHRVFWNYDLRIKEKPGITDLEVRMDPGLMITGRVIDDATKRPVTGALVGPASDYTDLVSLQLLGYDEVCVHAITDEEGRFTLKGLRREDDEIAAVHPDYTEGICKIKPGSTGSAEIRLKEGHCIFGQALDDGGKPAENLLIRIHGRENPISRPVLTDSEGRYRTPPIASDRVFLKAGSTDLIPFSAGTFTDEFKVVEVMDRDLEVNFGPSADHVIWQGTFYGYNGEPEANRPIFVNPSQFTPTTVGNYNLSRLVQTDDQGRFQVQKLRPGQYRVSLHPSSKRRAIRWGHVEVVPSEIFEYDINLSQDASLAGVVVNCITGLPFEGKEGLVMARQNVEPYQRYHASFDGTGQFKINGVPPGSYTVQAAMEGIPSKPNLRVKVEKGESLEDLQVPLSPRGRLQLTLSGFDRKETFSLYFTGGEDNLELDLGKQRIHGGEAGASAIPLESGTWQVSLDFPDLGHVQREFFIMADRDTELEIHRSEIYSYEGTLSVSGEVRLPDGSPAREVPLVFKAYSVPNMEKRGIILKTVTTAEGAYMLDGFKPGRWGVKAELEGDVGYYFHQLWIPFESKNPHTLDLSLPAGLVHGALHDLKSGLPLDCDLLAEWTVYLQDVKRDRYVSKFEGGKMENLFHLACRTVGEYQLLIEAEGYQDYRSSPFTLDSSQSLDLGKVMLDPCGVLDVEVVDEALQPVGSYYLICGGWKRSYRRLEEGKRRYDKLPLDWIDFEIQAKGYLVKGARVRLDPAKPETVRVILQKNP